MAPAAGNNDGEATVFIATSLDTRLVTTVSGSDTVSDFKKKLMLEHLQCFPAIGNIRIHSLKVKRRGVFYHLSDSMLVKSAFGTTKGNWFVSVDASSLEQDVDIQHFDKHKVGDGLALLWVTHNSSIHGHDNHGSLSIHPKTVPFENQIVSNINGDSCKHVSKNLEEGWSSVDKQLATSKDVNSKKRTREVNNENLLKDASECGLPVKKKRKTQRVKCNVKASEENMVLTYDNDKVKHRGVSMNNENAFEHKSKDKDLIGERRYDLDQVAAVVPSRLEDVERETVADVAMVAEKNIQHGMCEKKEENELAQKAVMENEIPSLLTRASDCERDAAGLTAVHPVKRGSKRSSKHKAAETEVSSTSFIKKLHNINKDAIDSSQQEIGSNGQDSRDDLVHKHKEDREFSLKQEPEVKLPERRKRVKKSASRNKNETLVVHADDNLVGDVSSTVIAPVLDGKIVGEKNEVLETTLIDDSKKNDEMIVKEMEVSKNKLKDVGSKKRKKDVVKTALKNDESVVKQSNDVATSMDSLHVDCVRNDDILMNNDAELLRTEKILNKVKVEDIYDTSEKPNEKMNGVMIKTRKKKTNKSTSIIKPVNGEISDNVKEGDSSLPDGDREDAQLSYEGLVGKATNNKKSSPTGPQDQLCKHQSTEVELESKRSQSIDHGYHLEDTSKNVTVSEVSKVDNEVGEEKKKTKSSLTGPQDRLSKLQSTEVELELQKSQSIDHHYHLEDTSKNFTLSEVSKINNEVDITNDGSHELNFVDHFALGDQPNTIASVDNRKDTKKPKKKTKHDSRNDGNIQSQKIVSKNEDFVGKANKNNKSSLTGPQDQPSMLQPTEVELKIRKSQRIDHRHHLEDTSKNVTVFEVSKVNNEVEITNDGSHELNSMDHFAPGHQPNKTVSIDNRKDMKKLKKKTKVDSRNDGNIQPQKIIPKNEDLVGKGKKSNKSSLLGPQDHLIELQSTEAGLESKKSQSIDHHHDPEDTSKNMTGSEVSKVNNEAGSYEINFMDYFALGHQPNKTASIVQKDTKKPKKIISKSENNKVVTSPNIPNINQIKTPRTTKNIDAESSSSSQSFGRSFHNQKGNKQQSAVGPVKNILPVVNSLLKTPGKIFGDYDSDRSSADDNATVNSDSSTRTPSRNSSSSSGESASSIDSRRNRSHVIKRKEGGGKNRVMSQNKLKNMSMSDLLRRSSRFKKAKFTASQVEDTESQPVDFVPDTQPLA